MQYMILSSRHFNLIGEREAELCNESLYPLIIFTREPHHFGQKKLPPRLFGNVTWMPEPDRAFTHGYA